MDQAFALVTDATKNLQRRVVKNGQAEVMPRKYRKDYFPNNFLGDKTIAVSLMHDGGYIFYLKEATRHPVNRKIINLFERKTQPTHLMEELSKQVSFGR